MSSPVRTRGQCSTIIPKARGVFVGAVTDEDFTTAGAVPITLGAGGISIHHVRALHGSAPNTSPHPRRLLFFQYCANDAWPLVGFPGWDAFNAEIVCGEATNVPRVTNVPVRIPLPSGERGWLDLRSADDDGKTDV